MLVSQQNAIVMISADWDINVVLPQEPNLPLPALSTGTLAGLVCHLVKPPSLVRQTTLIRMSRIIACDMSFVNYK